MDDSTGRNNLQDVADYIDGVLKSMQIGARDKNDEPTEKVRWKELEINFRFTAMTQSCIKITRHLYAWFSNVLNPDPEMKR